VRPELTLLGLDAISRDHRERDDARAELGDVVVGFDLASVDEVAGAVERLGERYLRRVYTDHEIATSRAASERVFASSLAARFAAKEAVFKVLRVGARQPAWTDVELRRTGDGGCELRLHRLARTLADEAGLGPLAVSISHEAGLAGAFVAGRRVPVSQSGRGGGLARRGPR
jgi:holo-[acyl-carrier protein] synthase